MSEDKNSQQNEDFSQERDKDAKPVFHYDWWGYILIGIVLGAFNVWLNWYMYFCTSPTGCDHLLWDTSVSANDSRLGYWGFFIVPFLFVIPAIIFSNMKRQRGYAYVIGYVTGGLIGMIWSPYLGIYTSSVAAILFLIIYFIFWKIWRSFTKFTINEDQNE